jgi:hypothetical protein
MFPVLSAACRSLSAPAISTGRASWAVIAMSLVFGCDAKPTAKPNAAMAPSASAPPKPSGAGGGSGDVNKEHLKNVPSRERVEAVINPKHEPAYAGPTATVRGVIRASGDVAPRTPLKGVDAGCEMAEPMYGRLFREGPGRELADALVAVTHYKGYVPPRPLKVTVYGHGCAWDRRTIGLDFGQYIEVVAKDRRPYVPELLGERTVAQLFALPGGDPIALVPTKVGRFVLHDSMRIYSRTNVFVVGYPTHDVTGIDGIYEITGIPIGKAKVGAMLPESGSTISRDIELKSGEVLTLDLELPFDQKAYDSAIGKAAEELKGATRATNATP